MVQEAASSGKVPCLAAALRWGAKARTRTTAATSIALVPMLFPRTMLKASRTQEVACWVTQAMKFSSPVPVSSAIVCPWPQMVAKSTLPAPACWSAKARLTSTVEAVSP